jgi:O-antigen biosynthesis protein
LRTLYTTIIGAYDDLKQPFKVSQHWKYVCFTDQEFDLPRDNVWEIIKVPVLDCGPAKTARRIKIMFHEYVDTEDSIFIDGTFFINTDLNRWWRRFQEPMTVINHPFDNCIFTDIKSCMKGGKGDFWKLIQQAQDYKEIIPENNGLISSGILMRKNTKEVRELCETWWKEVEKYTERDQIAFGYAAVKHPGVVNTFSWNYTTQNEFIHCPHMHKEWREGRKKQIMRDYGSIQK